MQLELHLPTTYVDRAFDQSQKQHTIALHLFEAQLRPHAAAERDVDNLLLAA